MVPSKEHRAHLKYKFLDQRLKTIRQANGMVGRKLFSVGRIFLSDFLVPSGEQTIKRKCSVTSITVIQYHIPKWVPAISPPLPQPNFFSVHNLQPAKGPQNMMKIWKLQLLLFTKFCGTSAYKVVLNAVRLSQWTVQVT